MSQTPRHINTSRSLNRPDPAAAAPRHAASSTDAKQSAGGAHNEPPRRPAQGAGQKPPRRRKKKKKMPLWLPFAVVMAIIAVISGVVVYGVSLVNKVEDSIRPDDSTPTIEEEVKTAEEYKGDVVNILVCGIDYEEGRNYSNDPTSNDGMTDMILYVQFDIKNGALRMLQIPRNSLVTTKNKKITLSNGKTYAATNYQINSVAISNGGSIAALADVIYDQFRLPIDYYVTVDMQALVDMVDNFGGIEVYIPHDMSYGGSKLLFATVLTGVCYRLYADVIPNPNKEKLPDRAREWDRRTTSPGHAYQEMFNRRLLRGQSYMTPFLGWSEFTLSYFGPFRETTKVCKELPDIHIPSMLRRVFLTGHESNERAIYQAVYDMDLCIHQGVLEYPVREEEYRDQ